jgi:hypothetical protein
MPRKGKGPTKIKAVLTVSPHGPITAVFPKNGKRDWLRVQLGSTAQELWIPVSNARQLHAVLGACLAELDDGSQEG